MRAANNINMNGARLTNAAGLSDASGNGVASASGGPFTGYVAVATSTLTLATTHHAQIIVLTAAVRVIVTVPSSGLPANFYCRILNTATGGGFKVVASSGVSVLPTTTGATVVKVNNVPADLYAIGATAYLLDGQKLSSAYVADSLASAPVGAYSVSRRIIGSYAGNAVEVRRSSDNTAQTVGFTGDSLSTSALTTFVGSGSAYFKTLYDQSGNARNLVQATAANQPRIANAGTIETNNSIPGVRLLAASNTYLSSPISITSTALTAVIVGSMNDATQQYGRLISAGSSGNYDFNNSSYANIISRNSNSSQVFSQRGGDYTAATVTNGTAFTYVVRWDGVNYTVWFNGTQIASGMSTGPFAISTVLVGLDTGLNWYWDGFLQELYLYNTALSNADVATLQADLKSFYGTP